MEKKKSASSFFEQPRGAALVVAIFLLYALSRLWPVLVFGDAAFGYDTGIYRRISIDSWNQLGDSTVPAFAFSSFSNLFFTLGNHVDDIIVGAYIVVALLVAIALYAVVLVHTNKRAAFFSLLLFTLSLVQWEFYTWYYFRNILALFFMLTAWLLLYYRSPLIILPLATLGAIHPISLVPFGLMLMVLCVMENKDRRYLLATGIMALTVIMLLNWKELQNYLSIIFQKGSTVRSLSSFDVNELTGQFMNGRMFLWASYLYLPLGVAGLVAMRRRWTSLTIFAGINTLLIVVGVLFYRRFFVLLDVTLIIGTGVIFSDLWQRFHAQRLAKVGFALYGVMLLSTWGRSIATTTPIISPQEILDIQSIGARVPPGKSIMVLSSSVAPWVYGFTSQPIIAPGLFAENKWNYDEWQYFWRVTDPVERRQLLRQYNQPSLFIYVGPSEAYFADQLKADPQARPVHASLWEYAL